MLTMRVSWVILIFSRDLLDLCRASVALYAVSVKIRALIFCLVGVYSLGEKARKTATFMLLNSNLAKPDLAKQDVRWSTTRSIGGARYYRGYLHATRYSTKLRRNGRNLQLRKCYYNTFNQSHIYTLGCMFTVSPFLHRQAKNC